MDVTETIEIWKTVQDFQRYEISSIGNFKCDGFPKEVRISRDGYKATTLIFAGRQRTVGLHRLVLEAFGPPCPSAKHFCGHNDGNRLNNVISNLRWVTWSENADDARKHALIDKHGIDKYEEVTGERPAFSEDRPKPQKKARHSKLVWKNPFGELPPTEWELMTPQERHHVRQLEKKQ